LFAVVVFGLISSVLSQEIGWEEHLWNDLLCVESDVKPSLDTQCKMQIAAKYMHIANCVSS